MKDVRYDEDLAALGAKVRYKCYGNKWTYERALQLHCKLMIVDGTVLTGSLTWSQNSELKTIENLIVLDRPAITRSYSNRFGMMWNYGEGTFPQVLEQLKAGREDYYWFSPVSASGEQVSRLLREDYKD